MVTVGNQKRFFFFAIPVSPQSVLNQIGILPPLTLRAHVEKSVLPGVFSILALALDPDLDRLPSRSSRAKAGLPGRSFGAKAGPRPPRIPAHPNQFEVIRSCPSRFPSVPTFGVVWSYLVQFGALWS